MKSFFVIGDTHGNHNLIKNRVKTRNLDGATLLHVGDFGVGFIDYNKDLNNLGQLNKFLRLKDCHLYVIRGNHDNPMFFNGEHDYSNLHLLPDYSVIDVNGDSVLMVGGAISVDRKPRKDNMLVYAKVGRLIESYWSDECFILNEEKLKDIEGVKYVITHSSPKFTFPINDQSNCVDSHGPFVQRFAWEDYALKDDLNKERNDITRMWEILQDKNHIDKWFYGHFHTSKREVISGTEFILLDINEFYKVVQESDRENEESEK
jgi:predicted phosphodiesterase